MAVELGDPRMLDIGKHCYESACNQLDFLPFSCPYCKHTFCGEHWRPNGGHTCREFSAADNRIDTPACPLCRTPVPVEKGADPNIAMDRHLSSSCPSLDPRSGFAQSKGKPSDVCAATRCSTRLVAVSINCQSCHRNFCAKHRMPRDHACLSPGDASASKSKGMWLTDRILTNSKKGGNTPPATSHMPQSGLAALRRARQSTVESLGSSRTEAIDLDGEGSRSTTKHALGLSKTDRRAKVERANAIKSLEGRAAKGLLTDDQKLELATLKAKDKRGLDLKDDNCIIL